MIDLLGKVVYFDLFTLAVDVVLYNLTPSSSILSFYRVILTILSETQEDDTTTILHLHSSRHLHSLLSHQNPDQLVAYVTDPTNHPPHSSGLIHQYPNLSLLSKSSSDPNNSPCSPSSPTSSSGSIWIVKPMALSCGRDFVVVHGIQQVLNQIKQMNYQCVVQKYIERPLLVRNNRKFDIRQWILVTHLNPLVIYGFSECYLRLSGKPYTLESDDRFIHLCNHSVQKDLLKDDECECGSEENTNEINEEECDTMMSQQEFIQALQSHHFSSSNDQDNLFESRLLPQIRSISIEAVKSCRDRLEKVGKGFEWLGLDLMVTETLDVALIEVNVSPDMTCSTPVTKRLIGPATKDLFELIFEEGIDGIEERVESERRKRRRIPQGVRGSEVHSIVEIDSSKLNEDVTVDPLWQLWYVGDQETSRQMKDFTAKKISLSGNLREKSALLSNILEASQIVERILDGQQKTVINKESDGDDDEI